MSEEKLSFNGNCGDVKVGKIRYNNSVSDELGKRAGLVQWRQHLPSINMAWIRFLNPSSYCMWTEFVVLYSVLSGFSLATPVLPSHQKSNIKS